MYPAACAEHTLAEIFSKSA